VGLVSLLLLALFIFVLGNLLFIPVWVAAWSLAAALTAPAQFLAVATNKRLRRNHALEHATINVLEERFGPHRLAGLAREDGFIIKGWGDPKAIRLAAEEGLARLKRGEKDLAVHDRCGTSWASANFVTAVVFLVLLFGLGRFSLANVILVMLLANLGGPVLGRLFQRYVTTSTDVEDLFITGFECQAAHLGWGRLLVNPALAGIPVVCHIRTATLLFYEDAA